MSGGAGGGAGGGGRAGRGVRGAGGGGAGQRDDRDGHGAQGGQGGRVGREAHSTARRQAGDLAARPMDHALMGGITPAASSGGAADADPVAGAWRGVGAITAPASPLADAADLTALTALDASLQLQLPDGAPERLLAYRSLLQRWNQVYNLTALRDPSLMWSHHLVDCLAALPALQRAGRGGPQRVLDVGSGGGLPGVVWAIARPQWQIGCVDTVAKKAGFIRQAAAELRLPNLQAHHARVESLRASGGYQLITSRAFASLRDFTRLTRHLLAADGCWLAMKGKHPADELSALPSDVEVFHVEQLPVPGLDAERCLVWMRPKA